MTPTDEDLLATYVSTGDESAFAALHARHSGMVRGVCLRMVGEAHADDVCQATFLVFARKAKGIKAAHLPGWLHRTAWYIATRHRRDLQRQQAREAEAAALMDNDPNAIWEQIAPHIDGVIAKLPRKLREAIVLYFFEGKTQREVGEALGCSEEAARKRITRATEQMRKRLSALGVIVAGSSLSAALLAKSASAPAAAVAKSATSQALADATIRAWQMKTALHVGLAVIAVTMAIAFFPRSEPRENAPPQPLQPQPQTLPSVEDPVIARAVESLLREQGSDGRFAGRSEVASTALAARALVAAGHRPADSQALARARDALLAVDDFSESPYLRPLVVMALAELGEASEGHCDAIVAAQSASGLWQDHAERGLATTLAISAWHLQALEQAAPEQHAGAIAKAQTALRRLARPDAYSYSSSRDQLSPGAHAVASLFGQQKMRASGRPNAYVYHQLFNLHAAWQQAGNKAEVAAIRQHLLTRQSDSGAFAGDDAFDGGAYATAWAILCLRTPQ